MAKSKKKKHTTAFRIVKVIIIGALCILLLVGIALRIWHFYKHHNT